MSLQVRNVSRAWAGGVLCLCSIWEDPNGWNLPEVALLIIWHLGWDNSRAVVSNMVIWSVILDKKSYSGVKNIMLYYIQKELL